MNIIKQKKRTFEEVIALLDSEYTISIKKGCMMLKCSRSWFNKYVKPYCDFIYLNNGIRGDEREKVNWVYIASQQLERENMTECVWLNDNDVYNVIQRSILSITRQTIQIPVDYLLKNHKAFYKEYETYSEKIEQLRKTYSETNEKKYLSVIADLRIEQDKTVEKYLSDTGESILKHRVKVTERSKAKPVEVKLEETNIAEWVAPHDVKEYGDTDEMVYRRFFREGYIKIECQFVAKETGEIGKKTYYVKDQEPLQARHKMPAGIIKTITIPYSEWLKIRIYLNEVLNKKVYYGII